MHSRQLRGTEVEVAYYQTLLVVALIQPHSNEDILIY